MKTGLNVGLTMLAIAASIAACAHEAKNDTMTANKVNPGFFESSAPRPRSAAPIARSEQDEGATGRTDKFLWDNHSAVDDKTDPRSRSVDGADGGVDGGPHAD